MSDDPLHAFRSLGWIVCAKRVWIDNFVNHNIRALSKTVKFSE